MATTHLVGPVVGFKSLDRVIQRCALCGEKLDDYRPSCIAFATPDDDKGMPSFPEGHLMRVAEGNPKSFVVLGPFATTELPEDFCLSLVE